MTDTEIETLSTLFILLICTVVIGGTVGWWVFLRMFKMIDDYLQTRQLKQKGWDRMISDNGKVWYTGYKD